jgi:hypothetical protein
LNRDFAGKLWGRRATFQTEVVLKESVYPAHQDFVIERHGVRWDSR